jgi:tetratricopeptide (TPR) repeat protein
LISYALYQFGDRVLGKAYRERAFNGERMDNSVVELGILIPMYLDINSVFCDDKSLSIIDCDGLTFSYQEKMLELLRPWSAYLDLNSTSHIDTLDKDQINHTLLCFSQIENNMGSIYTQRNQFDLAESHCQQALSYARLFEGIEEDKTDLLCRTLEIFYTLRRNQGKYDEAFIFVEEAYNCVAITYNLVHPKVQKAASTLIECLIFKGDFERAETFAQMTLDSLKDPGNGLNQQSEEVAKGYYDLGYAINRTKRDYVEAETLLRESLRIRSRLHDSHHELVGISIGLLARNLESQGNLGGETKDLHERSLVINMRNCGSEGVNTAVSNFSLGYFYHLRAQESQTVETLICNCQKSSIGNHCECIL